MNEQEYREAVKPYLFSCGLVSHKKGKDSGNGWVYTSQHYYNLFINGWLNDKDKADFRIMMIACMPKALGLLQRSHEKEDYQSHDDLTAVMMILKMMGMKEEAKWIYDYCQKRFCFFKYVYNTQDPGVINGHSFLWRFFHFRAHMDFCTDNSASMAGRLMWEHTVESACNASVTDQDSWFLTWCLVVSLPKDQGSLVGAARAWQRAYFEKFTESAADGLFARTVEFGHPVGQMFKYKTIFFNQQT